MFDVGDVIKSEDGAEYEIIQIESSDYILELVKPAPVRVAKTTAESDYEKVGP